MKHLWLVTILMIAFAGCGGPSGPPPLTVEEIPAAITKVFQSAKLLVKQNAISIAKLVEDKKFAGASIQLQALLPQELSKEQRDVVSAALQTLNQILQEQAASIQGSPAAEAGAAGKP